MIANTVHAESRIINDGSTLTTRRLIAILLGRLKMDVDECITDYTKILRTDFNKDKKGCPINWKGNVKGHFNSNVLAEAFEDILKRKGLSSGAMLNDGGIRGNGDCKVYVNIVLFGNHWTNTPSRLFVQPHTRRRTLCVSRSYAIPGELEDSAPKILEAARATSAATSYFEPVTTRGLKFVDGALGANNPVNEVWTEFPEHMVSK